MERTSVTDDDKGKRVVNSQGDEVGVVSGVDGEDVHVTPDAELPDATRSKLGWSETDQSEQVLPGEQIEVVTDEEVRMKDDV